MLYPITISTNRSQGGLSNVNEVVRNLLIIIGWKTASNTPLCTPPVPPVGKYYDLYFWERYVIIMDIYWGMYKQHRWYSAYSREFYKQHLNIFILQIDEEYGEVFLHTMAEYRSQNVIYVGTLSLAQTHSAIAQSVCLVNSSLSEGMSGAILEVSR